MWERGESAEKIAKHVGLGVPAVYWRRVYDKWTPRAACKPVSKLDWSKGRAMWEAGESAGDIASTMGTHRQTVYAAAHRLDWPKRKDARRTAAPKAPKGRGAEPPRVGRESSGSCCCGSVIARLVLVEGCYVHRCETCVPDWWAQTTRRVA
jgi:hypothetical protein